jgi:hypothetical protein
LAHALRDTAMRLSVYDHWIDAAADVVDSGITRNDDFSGVGIDFTFAHCAAVRKHRFMHFVIGDDSKRAFAMGRACLGQFKKIECLIAR